MKYTLSLTIQKVINISDESDEVKQSTDTSTSIMRELEAAGWKVTLDNLESVEEEDDEDDDEDWDDEEDDEEEDEDEDEE